MEGVDRRLPNEIWLDIFSRLSDPADLARCRRVCKLFYDLIRGNQMCWAGARFAKLYHELSESRSHDNGNWHRTELPVRPNWGHWIDILPFSSAKGDWIAIAKSTLSFSPLLFQGNRGFFQCGATRLHERWGPDREILHVALLPVNIRARSFVALCAIRGGLNEGLAVWQGWASTELTYSATMRGLDSKISSWLRLDLTYLGQRDQLMVGMANGVVELWSATSTEIEYRILFQFDQPLRLLYTTPESPDLVAGVVGLDRIVVWRISNGYKTVLDYESNGLRSVTSLTFLADSLKNRLFLFLSFSQYVQLRLFDLNSGENTPIFGRELGSTIWPSQGRLWQTGKNRVDLVYDINNFGSHRVQFREEEGVYTLGADQQHLYCASSACLPHLKESTLYCFHLKDRCAPRGFFYPRIIYNTRNQHLIAKAEITEERTLVLEHTFFHERALKPTRWFLGMLRPVTRYIPAPVTDKLFLTIYD